MYTPSTVSCLPVRTVLLSFVNSPHNSNLDLGFSWVSDRLGRRCQFGFIWKHGAFPVPFPHIGYSHLSELKAGQASDPEKRFSQ